MPICMIHRISAFSMKTLVFTSPQSVAIQRSYKHFCLYTWSDDILYKLLSFKHTLACKRAKHMIPYRKCTICKWPETSYCMPTTHTHTLKFMIFNLICAHMRFCQEWKSWSITKDSNRIHSRIVIFALFSLFYVSR